MSTSDRSQTPGKNYAELIEVAIQLTVIATLVVWCFKICRPFIVPVTWGVIISVALYPAFRKLLAALGGRQKVAAAVFVLVTLALVIVPTVQITGSLFDTAKEVAAFLDSDEVEVPPPPERVREWPLIGESLYGSWTLASENLHAAIDRYDTQIKMLARGLLGALSGFGAATVQSLFAILIAGLFFATAQQSGDAAHRVGQRLGGEMGDQTVDMAVATIRSVAQGVIGVALVQGLLAGVGLFLMGVPAAGLWTILVMVVAVIQLPPIVVLAPIAIYVFSTSDNTVAATIFLIWSLVVSGSDSILKPLFLGRGVAVPMPVILIGAIGGMLLSGFIGLFIGAVVLSIGYTFFTQWIGQGENAQPEQTEA